MADGNLQVAPKLLQALSDYGVTAQNVVEAHPQVFFDYQAYPAAGALSFTFFQNAIGQGGYTQGTTNMPANGLFPNPQRFLWTATELVFIPGATVAVTGAAKTKTRLDDTIAVTTAPATAVIVINTKEYLREAPLAALPCTWGVTGSMAIADTATDLGAIGDSRGELRRTSGQLIPSNTSVKGIVTFDAKVATPSTVAGTIGMRMYGIWYQLAQ